MTTKLRGYLEVALLFLILIVLGTLSLGCNLLLLVIGEIAWMVDRITRVLSRWSPLSVLIVIFVLCLIGNHFLPLR